VGAGQGARADHEDPDHGQQPDLERGQGQQSHARRRGSPEQRVDAFRSEGQGQHDAGDEAKYEEHGNARTAVARLGQSAAHDDRAHPRQDQPHHAEEQPEGRQQDSADRANGAAGGERRRVERHSGDHQTDTAPDHDQ